VKFGGTRGQLDDAQKTARGHWDAVCQHWSDAARAEHEEKVVVPLDEAVSEVLRSVDQLIAVFATVRRDCEFGTQ
jgi:hypothetical protein